MRRNCAISLSVSDELIERPSPGILRGQRRFRPDVFCVRAQSRGNCHAGSRRFGSQGVLVFQHPDTLWSGMLRSQHSALRKSGGCGRVPVRGRPLCTKHDIFPCL